MSNQTGDDDDEDNNIAPQRCLAYTHIIFVKDDPHTAHYNNTFNTYDHYDDYDDDMICLAYFQKREMMGNVYMTLLHRDFYIPFNPSMYNSNS